MKIRVKKSRNRQYMTNAETETGTPAFPFRSDHGGKRTHRSATEEWQPHRPQGDRSAEWWTLTAVLCDPAGTRYFSYSLPRLRIAGSVTYADERGKPTAVDVSGAGWADRQWGDFTAVQGW